MLPSLLSSSLLPDIEPPELEPEPVPVVLFAPRSVAAAPLSEPEAALLLPSELRPEVEDPEEVPMPLLLFDVVGWLCDPSCVRPWSRAVPVVLPLVVLLLLVLLLFEAWAITTPAATVRHATTTTPTFLKDLLIAVLLVD